jgi:threonine dehydratase
MLALKDRLAGQRIGVVVSGGNIDDETLRRVMNREI